MVILCLAGWSAGTFAAVAQTQPEKPLATLRLGWEEWRLRLAESWRQPPRLVYSAHVGGKLVALTIDDGPDPRFTPAILDILESEKVPATFFVVGRNAELYPDLVRREVADGDELGNHTYSHPDLSVLPRDGIANEILRGDEAIAAVTGQHTVHFRPPKGFLNRDTLRLEEERGERIILWSAALEHHELFLPQALAERVIRLTRPGAIILLHDGRLDRTKSVEALPPLIRGLKRKGYRFVTVSQLLQEDARQRRLALRGLSERWVP